MMSTVLDHISRKANVEKLSATLEAVDTVSRKDSREIERDVSVLLANYRKEKCATYETDKINSESRFLEGELLKNAGRIWEKGLAIKGLKESLDVMARLQLCSSLIWLEVVLVAKLSNGKALQMMHWTLLTAESLAKMEEWGQLSKLLRKSESLSKLMESRVCCQSPDFADLGKCYCLLGDHYLYSLKAAVRMGERKRCKEVNDKIDALIRLGTSVPARGRLSCLLLSAESRLEEAKVLLDKSEYQDALDLLKKGFNSLSCAEVSCNENGDKSEADLRVKKSNEKYLILLACSSLKLCQPNDALKYLDELQEYTKCSPKKPAFLLMRYIAMSTIQECDLANGDRVKDVQAICSIANAALVAWAFVEFLTLDKAKRLVDLYLKNVKDKRFQADFMMECFHLICCREQKGLPCKRDCYLLLSAFLGDEVFQDFLFREKSIAQNLFALIWNNAKTEMEAGDYRTSSIQLEIAERLAHFFHEDGLLQRALSARALVAGELGDADEAIRNIDLAIAMSPDNMTCIFLRLHIALLVGNSNESWAKNALSDSFHQMPSIQGAVAVVCQALNAGQAPWAATVLESILDKTWNVGSKHFGDVPMAMQLNIFRNLLALLHAHEDIPDRLDRASKWCAILRDRIAYLKDKFFGEEFQWLIATAWEMGMLSIKTGYLQEGSKFFDFVVMLLEKFPGQREEETEILAKVHVALLLSASAWVGSSDDEKQSQVAAMLTKARKLENQIPNKKYIQAAKPKRIVLEALSCISGNEDENACNKVSELSKSDFHHQMNISEAMQLVRKCCCNGTLSCPRTYKKSLVLGLDLTSSQGDQCLDLFAALARAYLSIAEWDDFAKTLSSTKAFLFSIPKEKYPREEAMWLHVISWNSGLKFLGDAAKIDQVKDVMQTSICIAEREVLLPARQLDCLKTRFQTMFPADTIS
eukprot:jgi/Picsp_1/1366/NSC_04845-R1_---NA---